MKLLSYLASLSIVLALVGLHKKTDGTTVAGTIHMGTFDFDLAETGPDRVHDLSGAVSREPEVPPRPAACAFRAPRMWADLPWRTMTTPSGGTSSNVRHAILQTSSPVKTETGPPISIWTEHATRDAMYSAKGNAHADACLLVLHPQPDGKRRRSGLPLCL